ncbi:helix-turn-helix domain-containing protein [Psychrobacter raelei]|uniref:Helix-turn-helix domain-containing protein n=1 Tax=Psychrobacter raelei TaxID=2565531 RepID=A0AAU6PVS7_9GAMM
MCSFPTKKKASNEQRPSDILKFLQDAGVDTTSITITKKDWDRNDVVYALRKAGTNMAALSKKHYDNRSTLNNVFRGHYPRGEQIVAKALGLEPKDIWPSRYS